MKRLSSDGARKEWANVQADATAGTPTLIERHNRNTCVVVPPDWAELYENDHWANIMRQLRQKYPGKSDAQIVQDLLQRWQWSQNSGGKDAKLDETLTILGRMEKVLLWVARKMGYEED